MNRTDTYYETQVYSGDTKPSFTKKHTSWQAAYAWSAQLIAEDCGVSKVAVIHRTFDAYVYRHMRWYCRSQSPLYYATPHVVIV